MRQNLNESSAKRHDTSLPKIRASSIDNSEKKEKLLIDIPKQLSTVIEKAEEFVKKRTMRENTRVKKSLKRSMSKHQHSLDEAPLRGLSLEKES